MSTPLVSSRRVALGLALTLLIAAAAEAQPRRPRPVLQATVHATPASDSFADFLVRLLAVVLDDSEDDLYQIAPRSETDSEIEVDPPNPVVQPQGLMNGGDARVR